MENFTLLIVAILAGCLLPIQAGINALLRNGFSRPEQGALVSFVVGSLVLIVYCVVLRMPWPSLSTMGEMPRIAWTGGILGAAYVTVSILVAPKLGASVLTACLVGGQLFAALWLDHFGILGFPLHAINLWRVLGACFIVLGVALIKMF